ncbi:MAG: ExeM/NucH family extracellular endonuclease, partial [Anaerolineae bacterium]|nr:ExeM/NucH family extracellular endonuclease [Anaerolineae bacterium]
GLSTTNYFRGGDTISNLTGILHWSFAGLSGTDAWRIRPVPDYPITFTPVNTRPSAPSVTGDVTVASYNVLNYFTTIDTTASNNVGTCGPTGTMDCRGADSNAELTRQTDKLVTALQGLDADIFGLIEIQNTIDSSTVAAVVTALNGVVGAGTYDYVNTGWVGTDAITNAFIYKTAVVQPITVYVDTDAINNRPTLAVLFEVIDPLNPSIGQQFHVVVNHFKSKGSSAGLPGDTDQGDGQANSNATRVAQANRLISWVNSTLVPNDPDVLVIGDLNSYKQEDPITTLEGAGYTDLVELFGGANAYSYLFDGQLGYLDHALANASLLPYITGATEWHINADEVPLFDYNDIIA